MVQLTIDTNNDSVEELEHALHLVQQAISRRQPKAQHYEPRPFHEPVHHVSHEPVHHVQTPHETHHEPVRQTYQEPVHQEPAHQQPVHQEPVRHPVEPVPSVAEAVQEAEDTFDAGFFKITLNHEKSEKKEAPQPVPTLNQLLSESLSDEDFEKLFKEQVANEKQHLEKDKSKQDAYIEIIEYNEEKN